jgi:predicted nucleic acid-binding protein
VNFLLETNVVSEGMRKQPNAPALNWIAAQNRRVTFHQRHHSRRLRRGSLLLGDGKKRKAQQRWTETGIKAEFAGRILPVDSAVMERWADIEASTMKAGRACR